uniref:C-type lectin domain-containing protein n=1 Tax=Hucho hucho TaxID=62062 RepID=A0A4W5KTZ7_9TELE
MAMLTILMLLSAAIVLGEAFDLGAAKAGVVEEQQEAGAAESDRPCPGGWTKYESRCFMFVNTARTWPQAESYCLSLGANLASVHNCGENYNLQQLVLKNTGQHHATWIGGSDAVLVDGSGSDTSSNGSSSNSSSSCRGSDGSNNCSSSNSFSSGT